MTERCREKPSKYQRAVNRGIELHNFTCSFKTRFEGGKFGDQNLKLVKVDHEAPGTKIWGDLCGGQFG